MQENNAPLCDQCETAAHCGNTEPCARPCGHTHPSPTATLFRGGEAQPLPIGVSDEAQIGPDATAEEAAHEALLMQQFGDSDLLRELIEDADGLGRFVASAGQALTSVCHGAAAAAGWWGTPDGRIADPRSNPMCWSNKLMLTVSELAESMEGDRKSLQDDHLPQYKMRDVELADAAIRLFDMAGAYGVPLGEIILAKLRYNAQRADHKPAARLAEGGKAY